MACCFYKLHVFAAAETRRVATMLPSLVAEVNCKLRKEHEDRAKMVIHGFKR